MTFKGDSPLFPNLGGQASQQGGVKGRKLELEISLLAIANYKNLLRITIWAEEFFHRGVDQNPLSAVRSPHSLRCSVWCFLYNAVGEPLTESVKFLLSRVVIAMFWKAKISFSLVKNIVFPRLQNMELVWTQKWRKIFYLKMNRNISRGSNMLTQLRSLGSVLKDIPQFFVQVSNFDITC